MVEINKPPPMTRMTRALSFLIWPALAFTSARYFLQVRAGGEYYKTGDWLINYEGGPVRRALVGHILYLVSETGLPLLWVVYCAQIAVYVLFFGLVHKIFLLRNRGAEWLLVFLCPAFLLFHFYDPHAAFRKEIIVFASFAVLAYAYARKNVSVLSIALSLVLYLLAGLSHELSGFTLPFFAFLLLKAQRSDQISFRAALVSASLFAAIALASLLSALVFPGGPLVGERICASLQDKDLAPNICNGALVWLAADRQTAVGSVIEMLPRYLRVYPVLFVLALVPLFLSSWWKKNILLVVSGFASLLPLFFVATDWGRWIHIYIFFLFVTLIADSVQEDVRIKPLPLWMACAYLTLWSIPHYLAGVTFGLPHFLVKLYQHTVP